MGLVPRQVRICPDFVQSSPFVYQESITIGPLSVFVTTTPVAQYGELLWTHAPNGM